MSDSSSELSHKQDLLRDIMTALKNETSPICHASTFTETRLLRQVDEYFTKLRQCVTKMEYLMWIKHYTRANQQTIQFSQVDLPRPVPLSSSHLSYAFVVEDMPHLWELTERRGRPASKINDAIASILSRNPKMNTFLVCKELDKKSTQFPKTSAWHNVVSWRSAYSDPYLRRLIHKMVSVVRISLKKSEISGLSYS